MELIQKPYIGIQLNRNHPLSEGLIGHWLFNEQTGNKALDLSGNGKHGTNNGTDWVPEGLNFNGTDDYVDILDSVAGGHVFANVGETLTVAAKLYPHVIDNGISAADWSAENVALELRTESQDAARVPFNLGVGNSKIQFGATSLHGTDFDLIESTSIISTNTWYDVFVTVNGDDYNMYIDGILDKSGTFSKATGDRAVGSTACNMQIGVRSRNTGEKDADLFNGLIGNISIYNRSISAEEVAWLHREPGAMFETIMLPAWLCYELPIGWTGKINSIINPAKVNTIAAIDIYSVMGIQ